MHPNRYLQLANRGICGELTSEEQKEFSTEALIVKKMALRLERVVHDFVKTMEEEA